jgi:hypothetical protein
MKQTAVEFLIKELDNYEKGISEYFSKVAINNHARRMEKDQICEAYAIGGSPLLGPWEFGEEYYNETFNK